VNSRRQLATTSHSAETTFSKIPPKITIFIARFSRRFSMDIGEDDHATFQTTRFAQVQSARPMSSPAERANFRPVLFSIAKKV